MSTLVQNYHDYIMQDILHGYDDITSKPMFGGFGLYKYNNIFAIITSDGVLYFKATGELATKYEQAGAKQFVYSGFKNKKITRMPYWSVPEHVLEDKAALAQWINSSSASGNQKTP